MITVFTNATLLDGSSDMKPQEHMSVVVKDDKIAGISPDALTKVPEGAREINLNGAYLAPGLVNMHVHLCGSGKPYSSGGAGTLIKLVEATRTGKALLTHLMKDQVQDQLFSGVTTVRSVGDPSYCDIAIRNKINAGKVDGPRLLCSGTGVTVTGGHGAGLFAKIADMPEAAREVVRQSAAAGADLIKLFITGGVMDSTVEGEAGILRMSQEIADAVVDEAHKLGLPTAAHIESTDGVRCGLKAGVDTIEHGGPLDDELIALFKNNGVGRTSSLTTTFSPALPYAVLPIEKTKATDIVKTNSNVVFDGIVKCCQQALDNSVSVGLGTDSACPYVTHYDMWREVVYFHYYTGVSNAFALFTATKKNAELLGLGDETGSIEIGKSADMIVLNENPLDDLRCLKDVAMVMCRGKLYENPQHRHNTEIDETLETFDAFQTTDTITSNPFE